MTKTQRLYGKHVDPRRWQSMNYIDVLKDKINLASIRIKDINMIDIMERNHYGITECMNAIKWCREMIKETEDVRD